MATASPETSNAPVAKPAAPRHGESAAHFALKRLALLWAQENDYPIAALEVSLPKCRYRADDFFGGGTNSYRGSESRINDTVLDSMS